MGKTTVLVISFLLNVLVSGNPTFDPDEYYNNDAPYDYGDNYGNNYNEDIGQEDDEEADKVHIPIIIMEPKTIVIEQDKTIRLPCIVDKLPVDAVQILWSRVDDMNTMIAMGKDIIQGPYTGRAGVLVEETGSTLLIEKANEGDNGQYKCRVATGERDPPQIVHTVTVMLAPQIVSVNGGESDMVTAQQGDDVTLSCTAVGDPTPTISWSRKGSDMPDGREIVAGGNITLLSVSSEDSGIYVCSAYNGNSEPVSKGMIVKVEEKSEDTKNEDDSHYVNDDSEINERDTSEVTDNKPTVDKMTAEPSSSSVYFISLWALLLCLCLQF